MMREYSLLDHGIIQLHSAVQTLLACEHVAARDNPGDSFSETPLSAAEKKHIAGLMRVNHAGEVCAQALYQGQALTAGLADVRAEMKTAAAEEVDHLAWCEQRLAELNSQPSSLNPIWYVGSLTIGMLAGAMGDRWSLGFVAETENQVTKHLQDHIQQLPAQDKKTLAILEQMQTDEQQHAQVALTSGGRELPSLIKNLMHYTSKIMTKSTYWI